ncbi:2'-5' RNA ligase family protein [Rufibacter tibetensis]|uniref:2'-5' RNA ligase n=1 Tax=Rufibacter tibetensis TaxID=512763 RepID=A0A0P0CS66_9BACT|nr:2'-5' RNA ligase family protein [Rufibacter tibetensis]ALJ00268.1 hypothetical protein DC20_16425 [Rufibacter tibetensis]
MVAIVSLLDAQYSDKVNELIFSLEREFGLKGVQMTPYPHLTWLTVNDGSLHKLKATLGQAAGICCKFTIATTGLGVFPGEKPVLYIPVIRTVTVNDFHGQLHKAVGKVCQEIGPYYHPEVWMPHLSLALGDTTPEVVSKAILFLNRETYNWKTELDNITLLTKHDDLFLKDGVFPLVGDEVEDTIKLSSR